MRRALAAAVGGRLARRGPRRQARGGGLRRDPAVRVRAPCPPAAQPPRSEEGSVATSFSEEGSVATSFSEEGSVATSFTSPRGVDSRSSGRGRALNRGAPGRCSGRRAADLEGYGAFLGEKSFLPLSGKDGMETDFEPDMAERQGQTDLQLCLAADPDGADRAPSHKSATNQIYIRSQSFLDSTHAPPDLSTPRGGCARECPCAPGTVGERSARGLMHLVARSSTLE